mmetsp:Transcript_15753/g.34016  ORF Transcript_15753/g.34016 Transcript_15753/m.34016 type:complete len:441 (+) Transcript_15753:77-1399(+)
MVQGLNVDADAGWNPLILSTIAGMSTCLGALIVFCHPIEDEEIVHDNEATQLVNGNDESPKHRKVFTERMRGIRRVSPSTMAFSLALAGSVMVTVSVVSIGPECLAASSMPQNSDNADEENTFFIFGITLMPIYSWVFLHRLLSFGLGCLLYFLMSKYAFPEPEEIIAAHSDTLLNSSGMGQIEQSASSDKESDEEDKQHQRLHSNSKRNNSTIEKSSAVVRRGGGGSGDIEMKLYEHENSPPASPGKGKGILRRPASERSSCISFIKSFTTGSDLKSPEARRANRVAMLLFFSLLLHNFPEGLAVAASALESDRLGLTVTVGIMIHNIPEGIAIAIPCLKARPDSPWLCFILASVSGLAEPAGAFLSLFILRGTNGLLGEGSLENVLAFVAGIMITVSVLELLPEAKRHATGTTAGTAYYGGLMVGFVVMVATEFGMSL